MQFRKKTGFVLIVGRPNVGKSSLINAISKRNEVLVTNIAGTTLKTSRVVFEDEDSQIVFFDTPGISKPRTRLVSHLNRNAYEYLDDADLLLFLSPIDQIEGKGDRMIMKNLSQFSVPKIFVNTKADKGGDVKPTPTNFEKSISVSIKDQKSIDEFLKEVKSYLKLGPMFFDKTGIDEDIEFQICENIRGEMITKFNDELPHSIFVTINDIIWDDIPKIYAHVNIERESQKPIILGKRGENIKEISINARKKLNNY